MDSAYGCAFIARVPPERLGQALLCSPTTFEMSVSPY
jgi:hypothetical protein